MITLQFPNAVSMREELAIMGFAFVGDKTVVGSIDVGVSNVAPIQSALEQCEALDKAFAKFDQSQQARLTDTLTVTATVVPETKIDAAASVVAPDTAAFVAAQAETLVKLGVEHADTTVSQPTIDEQALRDLCFVVSDRVGAPKVFAALKEYGADRVDQIAAEKLAEVYAKVKSLV